METASTIADVQAAVRTRMRVRATGGGTKPALSNGANLSLSGLSGIVQYDPSEYTFTALAGTPVAEVVEQLARHGQYLPFDPPWAEDGATLGGTVAAGLSGSGRYRYGGVRDFLLGVRLVDGQGDLIRGGGNVVKNVAGFDLPKLMVGSLGRYGIIVEVSFKVFPAPEATATIMAEAPRLDTAIALIDRLALCPLDLMCLDLEPPGKLWVRVGGIGDALHARLARLTSMLESEATIATFTDDEEIWRKASHFHWARDCSHLVKLPLVPTDVPRLEARIARWDGEVKRHYSVGGNVVHLGWTDGAITETLQETLRTAGRSALALRGKWPTPILGPPLENSLSDRLLQALDAEGKFERVELADIAT